MRSRHINTSSTGWDDAYRVMATKSGRPTELSLWDQQHHAFLDDVHLVDRLRERSCRCVLDAGCGDGRNSAYLLEKGFSVIGVDVSGNAVRIARSRMAPAYATEASFMVGDIRALELPDQVDAVICADALGQMPDCASALAEFARVLKPGGILLVNFYDLTDDAYGQGLPHPDIPHAFSYRNTFFQFFDHDQVIGMFRSSWINVEIRKCVWRDPPHGDFRPVAHQHTSWVVWAEKREYPGNTM